MVDLYTTCTKALTFRIFLASVFFRTKNPLSGGFCILNVLGLFTFALVLNALGH